MTSNLCLPNDRYIEAIKMEIDKGKQVRIKTKGQSMIPFITGDHDEILLKKPTNKTFHKGSVLLVKLSNKRFVAHRVYTIKGYHLILMGDGNIGLTEQCTFNDVIAEVTAVIKNGRIIRKDSFIWNLFRYLWPSNPFLRRIFLGVYRKIHFIHEDKRTIFNQGDRRRVCDSLQ